MRLPACELVRSDGTTLRTDTLAKRVVVLVTYSAACPYSRAYEARLVALARAWETDADILLVVCSDPARFPEDHRPRREGELPGLDIGLDPSEQLARSIGARVTPEAFVFDASRELTYRGRIDDAPFHPKEVLSDDLTIALKAALGPGLPVPARVVTHALGTPIAYR